MLQIPNLDDTDYSRLIQRAVHKIPLLTEEWTDHNHHDPGITTLEIYAWLVDMLNYYMNAVGRVHILKYMKLLGVTPLPKEAARAWACIEPAAGTEAVIPADFPVWAGDKCFISEVETHVAGNRFCSLYYEGKNGIVDLTAFAGEGGSFARVFSPDGQTGESVYFGFEKALSGMVRLFVTVKEHQERRTLPEDFCLAQIVFSCFDGSEWVPADVVKDDTNGFLQSGVICLEIPSGMEPVKEGGLSGGYYLRATVTENAYDVAPEIGQCFLNPVRMVQKQPVCRRFTYTYGEDTKTYRIPAYLSEDEKIYAAVRLGDGAYRMAPGLLMGAQGEVSFEEDAGPEPGSSVDLLVVKEKWLPRLTLGVTDGCVGQEFSMFLERPCDLELILLEESTGSYRHWHYVEQLDGASWEDEVFTFDEEKQCVVFGDGIHGMVPPAGYAVRVSRCSVSDYEQGNVREGEIRTIRDERFKGYRAYNTAMARGGRGEDSLQGMQKRLEEKVLQQSRLASPGDYEKLVMEIPGLIIRGAKVLSAKEYCRYHMAQYQPYDVYVVVCPVSMKPGEELNPRYCQYISGYLEKYRMLNTCIHVTGPSYGGVSVTGSIRVKGKPGEARAQVTEFLQEYFREIEEQCCFGAALSYGDIFIKLESLSGVTRVEELHLILGGEMGTRNEKGDILLNGDCLAYLGEIDIEYKE